MQNNTINFLIIILIFSLAYNYKQYKNLKSLDSKRELDSLVIEKLKLQNEVLMRDIKSLMND